MATEDDNPDPGKGTNRRPSLLRWFRQAFGIINSKDNDGFSISGSTEEDEREKAIEKSIEQFASQLSASDNPIEMAEKEMIHGIVELGEKTVKEIMIPRVEIVGIECGTPISEVIKVIKNSGHSRLPLYKDSLDNIIGFLYAKDLLLYAAEGGTAELTSIARKAYFIPENKMVDELLKDLRRRRLHIAVVVDEYGGTSGIVTMEDIIEEIVGEIEDEFDIDSPSVITMAPNVFSIDGSLSISDLNSELDLNLPEEEFETVGGLIYDLVGSLPEKGSSINYRDLTFVVDKIEGQRIVRVRVIDKQKPNA